MDKNKGKILVIEDDKVDQMAFERFVRKGHFPYDYEMVGSVMEASEILKSERFDAVVIDYLLKDGNAFDLFDKAGDIPIIVVTNIGDVEVAIRAMKEGAYDYLIKDSEGSYLKTLPITVKNAITRKRVEEELKEYREKLEKLVDDRMAELQKEMNERRLTEAALRESEAKYRLLAENVTDCIWTIDLNLQFTYVSPSIKRLLGYTPTEMSVLDVSEFLSADSAKIALNSFREQIAEDSKLSDSFRTRTLELEYLRKDGSTAHAEVNTSLLRDHKGMPIGILGVTREITERKQAEEEKQKLQEQLLQAQKMESVGRLAGGVAHDFNNLLTAILGYGELVLMDLPEDHPAIEKMEIICSAGEKAAVLTRQLLAFSRKQVLEINVVNLNSVVNNMEKILARVIGTDVFLKFKMKPQLPNVLADPGQLEQVLMNLAVNARDAMPCGGTLTIETSVEELDKQHAQRHGGITSGVYVVLSVTDTGDGMSYEIRERIFEPFFTTKELGEGTGLGLATVYGIIKQHKGGIWVYSEPGKGTTFKIYLSIVDDKETKTDKKVSVVNAHGIETVLVVDDEPGIRRLIIDVLQPLGYRTLEASCGEEALQVSATTEDSVDLLLVDMVMPGMNGLELAETLEADWPEIKVIFMSGYADSVIADRAKSSGHEKNFLQKPLTPGTLTNKLREVLDK